jgi:hypothetical protein
VGIAAFLKTQNSSSEDTQCAHCTKPPTNNSLLSYASLETGMTWSIIKGLFWLTLASLTLGLVLGPIVLLVDAVFGNGEAKTNNQRPLDLSTDCKVAAECWELKRGHAGGALFWAEEFQDSTVFYESIPTECVENQVLRYSRGLSSTFFTENLPARGRADNDRLLALPSAARASYSEHMGRAWTEELADSFPTYFFSDAVNLECNGHRDWYLPTRFEVLQWYLQATDPGSPFSVDPLDGGRSYSSDPYLTATIGEGSFSSGDCLQIVQWIDEIDGSFYTECPRVYDFDPVPEANFFLIRSFSVKNEDSTSTNSD